MKLPKIPQYVKDNWKWLLVALAAGVIIGAVVGCQVYNSDSQLTDSTPPEMQTDASAWGFLKDVTAPEIGSGEFGDIKTPSISWTDRVKSTSLWMLYPIGGLFLALGIVVAIWLKQMMAGAGLAAGGVAVIVIAVLFDTYPIISLIIFALALVAAGVWVIWGTKSGLQLRQALGFEKKIAAQVIAGVQEIKKKKPTLHDDINGTLREIADGDVQDEITKRKANGSPS